MSDKQPTTRKRRCLQCKGKFEQDIGQAWRFDRNAAICPKCQGRNAAIHYRRFKKNRRRY